MSRFTYIALGIASLSTAGLTYLATIRSSSQWVPGSSAITGNQFLIPDSGTTESPGLFLKDEPTPIKTYPVNAPDSSGEEHCEGFTGALLCTVAIKLTGSGGHRAHNAGSYTCGTATCSIVDSRVFVESGSDLLYGGWTTAPGAASGAQLFNFIAASKGATLIGSGSHIWAGANGGNYEKQAPPLSTIKFVWARGDGTENHGHTVALAVIRFWKFYTP